MRRRPASPHRAALGLGRRPGLSAVAALAVALGATTSHAGLVAHDTAWTVPSALDELVPGGWAPLPSAREASVGAAGAPTDERRVPVQVSPFGTALAGAGVGGPVGPLPFAALGGFLLAAALAARLAARRGSVQRGASKKT